MRLARAGAGADADADADAARQIFPYFYFRPQDDEDLAFETASTVLALLPQIARDIEATAAGKQRERQQRAGGNQRFRPSKVVAKVLQAALLLYLTTFTVC